MSNTASKTFFGIRADRASLTRIEYWTWVELRNLKPLHTDLFGSTPNRERIEKILTGNKEIQESLASQACQLLIDEAYFCWIEDNKRALLWLAKKIPTGHFRSYSHWFKEPIKELIIADIDSWRAPTEIKVRFMKQHAQLWSQQRKLDEPFRWVQDGDFKKKVEIIENLLPTVVKKYLGHTPPFNSLNDLLFWMEECEIPQSEKELLLIKAKSRWSQNKYRENLKDRKQCNFTLKNSTISMLDKLCMKHQIKRNELIERLITSEQEQGQYLASRQGDILDGSSHLH
ncbi:hypothetical protein [Chitinimonas sp. BJYL2]|uniref:hypothetical protein n=1 Tax=Chitinimonas sp. BJYL2 TaxID=2976696 RepID=UPI0022B513DD|nr:hypothetical protein [Chitinimonas sp. BJYL2]